MKDVVTLLGLEAEINKVAPAAAASIMPLIKESLIKTTLTDGQKLIAAKSDQLSSDAQRKLENGQLEYTDLVKFIRRDITSQASNFNVFEESVDKEHGVSNFSKARLAAGENLMLERIELSYDRGSAITAKTADLAPVGNSDDNALYNGEISVYAGGKLLLNVPINAMNQPPKGVQGLTANCNGFNLKAPKLIKDNDEIQITIHFAGTMNSGGDKDIVEVKLIGDGIKSRS
jgi:hypothetical protein